MPLSIFRPSSRLCNDRLAPVRYASSGSSICTLAGDVCRLVSDSSALLSVSGFDAAWKRVVALVFIAMGNSLRLRIYQRLRVLQSHCKESRTFRCYRLVWDLPSHLWMQFG